MSAVEVFYKDTANCGFEQKKQKLLCPSLALCAFRFSISPKILRSCQHSGWILKLWQCLQEIQEMHLLFTVCVSFSAYILTSSTLKAKEILRTAERMRLTTENFHWFLPNVVSATGVW